MARVSLLDRLQAMLATAWHHRALSRKAISFGLIGLVNTAIDYGVFLLARAALTHSATALSGIGALSAACRCGDGATLTLVAANLISWSVAVSGSYVLNSSITFAAESGRKLRWGRYLVFVASGVAGWLANTAMLLIAAEIFLLPVWQAKAVAIVAGFVVNFSLSHFVVFRVAGAAANDDD